MKLAALLVSAAAAGLVALPATAQSSTDYFVDGTKGQDTDTCGAQATPCKTINWAEFLAWSANDPAPNIRVQPGKYNECVFTDDLITDPDSNLVAIETSLIAVDYETNRRNSTTILDATNCVPIFPNIPQSTVWMGDGGTLKGFTIQGGENSGVFLSGSGAILGNLIQNNKALAYQTADGAAGGAGGGISVVTDVSQLGQSVRIIGNVITGNQAELYGGGIDIFAIADDKGGVGPLADVNVVVALNRIESNTATGNTTFGGAGGGMSIFTSANDGRKSSVTVAGNNIASNTAKASGDGNWLGVGGGVYATAIGVYYQGSGPGTETVRITDDVPADPFPPPGGTLASKTANTIRSNVSEGYGGGIHAEIINGASVLGASQVIVVENNSVSANRATTGGGGIYAGLIPTFVQDPPSPSSPTNLELIVRGNSVSGNQTTVAADPAFVSGGGGAFIEFNAVSTPSAPGIGMTVERNTFQLNTSKSYGGGALLFLSSDAQASGGGGPVVPCDTKIEFHNNLLAQNSAVSATVPAGDGGGVYVFAQAQGAGGIARPELRFLSVVDNATNGLGGGVELDGVTATGGVLDFHLDNSIVVQNDAFGVGGLGADCSNTTLGYNDVFGNVGGQYESIFLAPGCTRPGDLAVDPGLSATTFVPALCSATVDAGDPSVSPSGEPVPNGDRVNMGHTGGTSARVPTLPDANGDHLVDGVEVLQIALSFASDATTNPARYNAAADLDFNGRIDGEDLSGVATTFGLSCP